MAAYIILIIMGCIICLVIHSIKRKYRRLAKTGGRAEGTLVGYAYFKIKNNNVKLPVVSFLTKENQNITNRTEESFFSSFAKIGSAVNVFYNPANPEDFMIQGKK